MLDASEINAHLIGMTLQNQLTFAPFPYDVPLAADAVEWFAVAPQSVRDLVVGMAGSSSYLRGLLSKEAEWFESILDVDPDAAFEGILRNIEAPLVTGLRQSKRRVALLLAACDLGGIWSLMEVTARLTRFADVAVDMALRAEIETLITRGKLPNCGPDDLADCAGVAVIAMGKMGARELNYSSDIDLIVLFDGYRHAGEGYDDARMSLQRATRKMAKVLSDVGPDGYVFRTDLRLRPNPSVTPVCVPMDAAERYYESEGRTWERAAFIKARACAGDVKSGRAFLDRITPFIWRKHLDFAAIQDAHDMRLLIREHKGLGGPIVVRGHDMKLGRGGIREIEFFAQTLQLIAGGRDKDLRAETTLGALAALRDKDWIPGDVVAELSAAYVAHRTTEHRIQMLRDTQTQIVPTGDDAVGQLAHLSGWSDVAGFLEDQRARLQGVHDRIEGFFEPEADKHDADVVVLDPALREVMDSWAGLPALRSDRSVKIFERLRPEIERRLVRASKPEFALAQLDGFMRKLPAGVQLFSMFEANPQILDLMMDICATAPALAQYLSRNTSVLDAVISGRFFEPLPDGAGYLGMLNSALSEVGDYEDALNATRRWQKEQHFRIGVLMLRKLAGLREVEAAYSDLACAVIQGVLLWVEQDVERRYGRFERQDVSVLGMGKLGSRQMTATSDLDLIVLYSADGDASDGRKSLSTSQYFARFTQTLITALSSPMSEGELYEVDMRLRPSGRQGPLATSLAGFAAYQNEKAWTWEHLALTRGRVIAGARDAVEAVRGAVLGLPREAAQVAQDVVDMRARLMEAKGNQATPWDVKDLAGGILAVELVAQMVALLAGSDVRDPRAQLALSDDPDTCALADTHVMLCRVQQAQRLVMDGRFDPEQLGLDGMSFVMMMSGFDSVQALQAAILRETEAANAQIERILAIK
ncbi:MAG: bifunctional [glutamine synthetase] adenylyltransferase/[glutamine synthetase]-adenylyl-L-tyrosine phosphorylase [Amylibacter sp.]